MKDETTVIIAICRYGYENFDQQGTWRKIHNNGGVGGRGRWGKKNVIKSQNTFTHTHYSKILFFFVIPFFINQCLLSSKHWTDTIFFWQNTSQEAHNLNCIKKLQQRSYLLLDKGFLMDIRETQIYMLHTLLIHHFFS